MMLWLLEARLDDVLMYASEVWQMETLSISVVRKWLPIH